MKIITLVPYMERIDDKIVSLTTKLKEFSQVVYFSRKMLLIGHPGWPDEVESKVQIIINEYDPDYLIVYTETSTSSVEEVREMLEIITNNETIFSIGVMGSHMSNGSIVQALQTVTLNDCSGRPGIYRISIYKLFVKQALYDCIRRCGSAGEYMTHVGNLARHNDFGSILYSPFLKYGHITKKNMDNGEDFCVKCNAHSVALLKDCVSGNGIKFGRLNEKIERVPRLKDVGPPVNLYCPGCERAKEIGVKTFGVQHVEGCPFREPQP